MAQNAVYACVRACVRNKRTRSRRRPCLKGRHLPLVRGENIPDSKPPAKKKLGEGGEKRTYKHTTSFTRKEKVKNFCSSIKNRTLYHAAADDATINVIDRAGVQDSTILR